MSDIEDAIWNRALDIPPAPDLRVGDRALADVVYFHGVVMNGGLLHAIGVFDEAGTAAAVRAYRHFGLDDAAATVEWVREAAAGTDLDADPDAAERLEGEADDRYRSAVPEHDETVWTAFARRLTERPEEFAPLGG